MPKVLLALGDDVPSEVVLPTRWSTSPTIGTLAEHVFGAEPGIRQRLHAGRSVRGGVVVAGENFGWGAVQEEAALALLHADLMVVARSFALPFYRNAINVHLPVVVAPGVEAAEGQKLRIEESRVRNESTGAVYPVTPLPRHLQQVYAAAGLVPQTRQLMLQRKGLV